MRQFIETLKCLTVALWTPESGVQISSELHALDNWAQPTETIGKRSGAKLCSLAVNSFSMVAE